MVLLSVKRNVCHYISAGKELLPPELPEFFQ